MNSIDISDSLTLKNSPGIKFTGNCGCGRPPRFVDSNRPPTSPKHNLVSAFASPFSLKAPAGHFRPESTALGASLSTRVTNAVPNTQEASVPFRQIKPVLAVSEVREKEAALKFQALHSQPVTPIKVDRLEFFLQQGYDPVFRQYLVDGFRFGFRINFVGERLAYESSNLKSALTQPNITMTKLSKECDAGRIVGPFTTPPFRNFRTSPLGLVPKKDPNEFRLIHHLSHPDGSSVNDFIPDSCSTVKYASVGDASKTIKYIGHGCFMAKTDIKSTFRIIPIHPADYSLLGIKWDDMYYFDRCLAMGLRSSCAIFEAFSTSLEWMAVHLLGASSVLHILDDFLFIAQTKEQCA